MFTWLEYSNSGVQTFRALLGKLDVSGYLLLNSPVLDRFDEC